MTSVYNVDDRPTVLASWKILNGISLQRVIRSTSCLVLASRVGFSGSADLMVLLRAARNPR